MSKHIFAIYHKNLSELSSSLNPEETVSLKNPELWNRLIKILRIKPKEKFIIFNEQIHVEIEASDDILKNKRLISGIIKKKEPNKILSPHITLYLPLLKKEALESVVYCAAATGVTTIVPIITEKSHVSQLDEKTKFRLNKIIIAACEQSKNFAGTKIESPVKLENLLTHLEKNSYKICFDEDGDHASNLLKNLSPNTPIATTLGPEGGFADHEKELLQNLHFNFYKLTPTILRSREAACVGLGLLRSLTL
jgi:16S rRNA (uracil1498-N3)-methyltransferase